MNHRFQFENLSLKKGIEDSHEKTSESLAETLLLNEILTKKELNIIAKNLNIKKPHKLSSNSLISHFKRFLTIKKREDLGFNKLSKRYISFNELERVQKLIDLSFDTLKILGELKQIRNYDQLSKEDFISALLRLKNPNEHNYVSMITSGLDTDMLDSEIREKINEIKTTASRLGNLLTNKERSKITKELYDILKKLGNTNKNTRLKKRGKNKILLRLIEKHNSLSKKQRFMDIDHNDLPNQVLRYILFIISYCFR